MQSQKSVRKMQSQKSVVNGTKEENKSEPEIQDTLSIGPKSTDSSILSWMKGGRKKVFKVEMSDGEMYEGCLLDGKFHGRGKIRCIPVQL
jgi:hypothetical protein